MLATRCAARTASLIRFGAAAGRFPIRAASATTTCLRWQSSTTNVTPPGYTGAAPEDYRPIRTPESPILEVRIKETANPLDVRRSVEVPLGPDYGTLTLPPEWLRDNCTCAKCVNPDSGQKSFSSSQIAPVPVIEYMERTQDGGLRIVWKDGGMKPLRTTDQAEYNPADNPWKGPHESIYSFEYLASLSGPPPFERYRQWPHEWFGSTFAPKNIQYADWMAGGEAFEEALLSLDRTGLIFVKDVPKDEKGVETIGSKIGNLYQTFYGYTWDVKSKKNAENVAYTNDYLGLHQDLMYKTDPPRIQLLHCLENSCTGGESMYSDGRAAARLLTTAEYERLAKWPVRYGYDRNGHLYNYERPVFTGDLENANVKPTDLNGQLPNSPDRFDVNKTSRWMLAWSPPFQSLQMSPLPNKYHHSDISDQYVMYRRATTRYQEYLEHPKAMLEYRMEPGDCVLFDNWRVLHGRRQFDISSGDRWLKGTYIDHQVFDSKVRTTLREREKQGKWQVQPMPDYPSLRTTTTKSHTPKAAAPKARSNETVASESS